MFPMQALWWELPAIEKLSFAITRHCERLYVSQDAHVPPVAAGVTIAPQ
jgi:hypothetical protein